MGDWENDREYTTYSMAPYRVKAPDSAWPAAIAYVATLAFIGFLLWMFFG